MKYILAIGSIILLIGGSFLFKNFSKNMSPYEGVTGFEIDFNEISTVDSLHIVFRNDNYAREIILYSWDGKQWQEESMVQDNNSPEVNLSNFKDTSLSTKVLRVVFEKPHKYPLIEMAESQPIYKNQKINCKYDIYAYKGWGIHNIKDTIFYSEIFTNTPKLLNLYFTTRPIILVLYTLLLALFLLLFLIVPGYVLVSFMHNISVTEKLSLAPIVSLLLLFFIGAESIYFHQFALAYIYLFIMILSIFIFAVRELYKDLLKLPYPYYLCIGMVLLYSFSLSLFMNSLSHQYLESETYLYHSDYVIPYNFTQAFYYDLDYHSEMNSQLLFGAWHFSDRTPLLPCSVFPFLILLGNTFKVFEIYNMILVSLFPLSVILLAHKWFGCKTALLAGFFIIFVPHIYVMTILYPFRIIMTYMLLLSFYFIYRNDKDLDFTKIILAGFCGAMAYLEHPNALSFLVGLVFYSPFTFKNNNDKMKSFLIVSFCVGIVFILWDVWSRLYDRPSVLYLYPLCLDNWIEANKYPKEHIIERFRETSFYQIIGNRFKSLIGLFNVFYGRDFSDKDNAYYRNTLTGSVMLTICMFAYTNIVLKYKKLSKEIVFFILIPLTIQLIGIGWRAKEMGIYITPIIFLLFLFGVNLISEMSTFKIILINLLCIVENIATVWIFHFDICQNLFFKFDLLGIFIVFCLLSVFILEIYFLLKAINNKSANVSGII